MSISEAYARYDALRRVPGYVFYEEYKRQKNMTPNTADAKYIIGNERSEEQQETPQRLQFMIEAYARAKRNAEADKARYTKLMERKKAKKWDAEKKAQMVRRFMKADQAITECDHALDQLKHRLEQITTPQNPNLNVAPFVPAPATSLEG